MAHAKGFARQQGSPYLLDKMMKKVLIAIIISLFFSSCNQDEKKISEGNRIVEKIENYKKNKGKLPESIEDIGIKETMEGPFFYEKKDSVNYMVWFGTSLGEGVYYYSDSNKWEDGLRGMK